MPNDDFPVIPKDLMERLQELYPERCADPMATDRAIWMGVGERWVVRMLQSKFDEQQEQEGVPSSCV